MTKIAVVTGANRGIGLETTCQLARSGVTTIVAARDAVKGAQVAEALRAEGLDAESATMDVDDVASIAAAAEWVRTQYGHVDMLINNAGIAPETMAGDDHEILDVEMFRRTFETN